MNAASVDWRALAESPRPGDHILYWRNGSAESDAVLDLFLRGALRRDDLIALVFPEAELAETIDRLAAWRIDPDRLSGEGKFVTVASEDISPRSAEDRHRIFAAFGELLGTALVRGRAGLSLLGRLAPVFFEAGNRTMAEMIEGVAHGSRAQSRILCLYDGRSLDLPRTRDASALVQLHTHTITGLGEGRFLAEMVQASSASRT